MQAVFPTRSLADQRRPHRYVPANETNVAKTFERARRKARLLAFLRRHVEQR